MELRDLLRETLCALADNGVENAGFEARQILEKAGISPMKSLAEPCEKISPEVCEKVHEMTHAYLEGRQDDARKLQLRYLKLVNAMFCETNPVPVKEMMNMAGMDVGGCRLPLGRISSANRRVLASLMDEYDLR